LASTDAHLTCLLAQPSKFQTSKHCRCFEPKWRSGCRLRLREASCGGGCSPYLLLKLLGGCPNNLSRLTSGRSSFWTETRVVTWNWQSSKRRIHTHFVPALRSHTSRQTGFQALQHQFAREPASESHVGVRYRRQRPHRLPRVHRVCAAGECQCPSRLRVPSRNGLSADFERTRQRPAINLHGYGRR
jgi:hypothetical protein